jgi:predicted membrane protein
MHTFTKKLRCKGIIVSMLIIAAGVLLLLFNQGVLPSHYRTIIFSWQMLVAAVGFVSLFSCSHSKGMGVVLMLLGGFLLLPKFDISGAEFLKHNILPIACIFVGLLFLLHMFFGHRFQTRWERRCRHGMRRCERSSGIFVTNVNDASGYIDYTCVFYSDKRKQAPHSIIKCGEINCVFSNFELDLSECQLGDGKNTLELNIVFANCILYVPAEWNVQILLTKAFGSIVDKRMPAVCTGDAASVLIITGAIAFGGGEIRARS